MSQHLKKGQQSANKELASRALQSSHSLNTSESSSISNLITSLNDAQLNPQVSHLLSSISKRDSNLCANTLHDLAQLIPTLTQEETIAILPHWSFHFINLALSNRSNVRENTCKVHTCLVRACGKQFASYLPQIFSWWYLLMHDVSDRVSSEAKTSFRLAFSTPERQLAVIDKLYDELVTHILSIFADGVKGLAEEGELKATAEERFGRVGATSLHAVCDILHRFTPSKTDSENETKQKKKHELTQICEDFFGDVSETGNYSFKMAYPFGYKPLSFTNLLRNAIPAIRSAAYNLVAGIAHYVPDFCLTLCATYDKHILGSFSESSPITFQSLFDMILSCFSVKGTEEKKSMLDLMCEQDTTRSTFVQSLSSFLKTKANQAGYFAYSLMVPLFQLLLGRTGGLGEQDIRSILRNLIDGAAAPTHSTSDWIHIGKGIAGVFELVAAKAGGDFEQTVPLKMIGDFGRYISLSLIKPDSPLPKHVPISVLSHLFIGSVSNTVSNNNPALISGFEAEWRGIGTALCDSFSALTRQKEKRKVIGQTPVINQLFHSMVSKSLAKFGSKTMSQWSPLMTSFLSPLVHHAFLASSSATMSHTPPHAFEETLCLLLDALLFSIHSGNPNILIVPSIETAVWQCENTKLEAEGLFIYTETQNGTDTNEYDMHSISSETSTTMANLRVFCFGFLSKIITHFQNTLCPDSARLIDLAAMCYGCVCRICLENDTLCADFPVFDHSTADKPRFVKNQSFVQYLWEGLEKSLLMENERANPIVFEAVRDCLLILIGQKALLPRSSHSILTRSETLMESVAGCCLNKTDRKKDGDVQEETEQELIASDPQSLGIVDRAKLAFVDGKVIDNLSLSCFRHIIESSSQGLVSLDDDEVREAEEESEEREFDGEDEEEMDEEAVVSSFSSSEKLTMFYQHSIRHFSDPVQSPPPSPALAHPVQPSPPHHSTKSKSLTTRQTHSETQTSVEVATNLLTLLSPNTLNSQKSFLSPSVFERIAIVFIQTFEHTLSNQILVHTSHLTRNKSATTEPPQSLAFFVQLLPLISSLVPLIITSDLHSSQIGYQQAVILSLLESALLLPLFCSNPVQSIVSVQTALLSVITPFVSSPIFSPLLFLIARMLSVTFFGEQGLNFIDKLGAQFVIKSKTGHNASRAEETRVFAETFGSKDRPMTPSIARLFGMLSNVYSNNTLAHISTVLTPTVSHTLLSFVNELFSNFSVNGTPLLSCMMLLNSPSEGMVSPLDSLLSTFFVPALSSSHIPTILSNNPLHHVLRFCLTFIQLTSQTGNSQKLQSIPSFFSLPPSSVTAFLIHLLATCVVLSDQLLISYRHNLHPSSTTHISSTPNQSTSLALSLSQTSVVCRTVSCLTAPSSIHKAGMSEEEHISITSLVLSFANTTLPSVFASLDPSIEDTAKRRIASVANGRDDEESLDEHVIACARLLASTHILSNVIAPKESVSKPTERSADALFSTLLCSFGSSASLFHLPEKLVTVFTNTLLSLISQQSLSSVCSKQTLLPLLSTQIQSIFSFFSSLLASPTTSIEVFTNTLRQIRTIMEWAVSVGEDEIRAKVTEWVEGLADEKKPNTVFSTLFEAAVSSAGLSCKQELALCLQMFLSVLSSLPSSPSSPLFVPFWILRSLNSLGQFASAELKHLAISLPSRSTQIEQHSNVFVSPYFLHVMKKENVKKNEESEKNINVSKINLLTSILSAVVASTSILLSSLPLTTFPEAETIEPSEHQPEAEEQTSTSSQSVRAESRLKSLMQNKLFSSLLPSSLFNKITNTDSDEEDAGPIEIASEEVANAALTFSNKDSVSSEEQAEYISLFEELTSNLLSHLSAFFPFVLFSLSSSHSIISAFSAFFTRAVSIIPAIFSQHHNHNSIFIHSLLFLSSSCQSLRIVGLSLVWHFCVCPQPTHNNRCVFSPLISITLPQPAFLRKSKAPAEEGFELHPSLLAFFSSLTTTSFTPLSTPSSPPTLPLHAALSFLLGWLVLLSHCEAYVAQDKRLQIAETLSRSVISVPQSESNDLRSGQRNDKQKKESVKTETSIDVSLFSYSLALLFTPDNVARLNTHANHITANLLSTPSSASAFAGFTSTPSPTTPLMSNDHSNLGTMIKFVDDERTAQKESEHTSSLPPAILAQFNAANTSLSASQQLVSEVSSLTSVTTQQSMDTVSAFGYTPFSPLWTLSLNKLLSFGSLPSSLRLGNSFQSQFVMLHRWMWTKERRREDKRDKTRDRMQTEFLMNCISLSLSLNTANFREFVNRVEGRVERSESESDDDTPTQSLSLNPQHSDRSLSLVLPHSVSMKTVDHILSILISPSLLQRDFTELLCLFSSDGGSAAHPSPQQPLTRPLTVSSDNVTVSLNPGTQSFTLSIFNTIDPNIRVDIFVQCSTNHPLTVPTAVFTRREGISPQMCRKWEMIAATSLSSSSSRSLPDAVSVLVGNVTHYESKKEPCPICFGIVDPITQSLPRAMCSECGKKSTGTFCLPERSLGVILIGETDDEKESEMERD
ncbi:hypothetical protein BLNAU_15583 [Blattamonas nauphoetae]|uniref:E3 ubiquitin-protein ligase listerin N-terminal domain-containing protein n=1 Tax=Blattamonas nauphoetae TaxID=2049346 RepID=A0ABQ9XH32_9EUKA|nr:hypothetical protein BLNAU_15583 [Blattamonas nauphoetae]